MDGRNDPASDMGRPLTASAAEALFGTVPAAVAGGAARHGLSLREVIRIVSDVCGLPMIDAKRVATHEIARRDASKHLNMMHDVARLIQQARSNEWNSHNALSFATLAAWGGFRAVEEAHGDVFRGGFSPSFDDFCALSIEENETPTYRFVACNLFYIQKDGTLLTNELLSVVFDPYEDLNLFIEHGEVDAEQFDQVRQAARALLRSPERPESRDWMMLDGMGVDAEVRTEGRMLPAVDWRPSYERQPEQYAYFDALLRTALACVRSERGREVVRIAHGYLV